jgi:hypothetical protein
MTRRTLANDVKATSTEFSPKERESPDRVIDSLRRRDSADKQEARFARLWSEREGYGFDPFGNDLDWPLEAQLLKIVLRRGGHCENRNLVIRPEKQGLRYETDRVQGKTCLVPPHLLR